MPGDLFATLQPVHALGALKNTGRLALLTLSFDQMMKFDRLIKFLDKVLIL